MKKILIPLIIFLTIMGFRLWGLNSQGQTWDEIAYYDGGKNFIRNIYHLDFKSSDFGVNYEHPPMAKWIYGIVDIPSYKSTIFSDKFTPGRAASATFGALTVLLVYFFTTRLTKSQFSGAAAALILAYMPHFVAHNKILGLETPTAFFYTLAAYLYYLALEKKSWGWFIVAGVSAAMAIGTRFNNAHIFLLMFLAAGVYVLFRRRDCSCLAGRRVSAKGELAAGSTPAPRNDRKSVDRDNLKLLRALIIPIIAAIVIYAIWPWIWTDTIAHLKMNQHFLQTQLNCQKDASCTDWFLGANIIPPWYYFIYYFFATTPVILPVLLLIFTVKFCLKPKFEGAYLLIWFLVPFAMSFIGFKQDGIRYIFPVLVPLAIICGITIANLFRNKVYNLIAAGLVVLYLLTSCLLIHPYYLDYYSEIVGGPKRVYEKKTFEISWWGEGIDTAYKYLNENAPSGSKILVLTSPDYSHEKLRSDLVYVKVKQFQENPGENDFDYIVTNAAFYWYKPLDQFTNGLISNYQILYQVKAQGAPIAEVYQKR